MTSRSRSAAPLTSAVAAALALLLVSGGAYALDRKVDTAAKAALKQAAADYKAGKYDDGINLLQRALDDCGQNKCAARTRAQVYRDIGALAFKKGDKDIAQGSFAEAARLDSKIPWEPTFDADVKAEWEAVRDEALIGPPPGGDFTHTPAPEQQVNTPLPIFVQYGGSAEVTKVIVKYQTPGAKDYRPLSLAKMGGGWGGMIPCADVKRGVVRYYVQGFNADGEPVAASGSQKKPFAVPVHWKISGSPPALPGNKAPRSCDQGGESSSSSEEPSGDTKSATASSGKELADGEVCSEDTECRSGLCSHGQCVSTERPVVYSKYARLWIGINGSVDFLSLPSASDVCLLDNSALPVNSAGYYCTNPGDGSDYPTRKSKAENATLVPGKAGNVPGGFTARDARVTLSLDYAFSMHFLAGVRLGYVFNTYPGQAAVNDGKAFGKPFHLEARATYLFGEDPLAEVGFRPYVFGALGLAEFDAQQTVEVTQNNVPGQRIMQAWLTAGPFFVAAGGGIRYAFSPRAAFTGGARFTGAFGHGVTPTIAPEFGLQYGF